MAHVAWACTTLRLRSSEVKGGDIRVAIEIVDAMFSFNELEKEWH